MKKRTIIIDLPIIKTIIVLFVVYSMLWSANYTIKYGGYAETVEYDYAVRTYYETNEEMNAVFGVMMPIYPSFTSFLYIRELTPIYN